MVSRPRLPPPKKPPPTTAAAAADRRRLHRRAPPPAAREGARPVRPGRRHWRRRRAWRAGRAARPPKPNCCAHLVDHRLRRPMRFQRFEKSKPMRSVSRCELSKLTGRRSTLISCRQSPSRTKRLGKCRLDRRLDRQVRDRPIDRLVHIFGAKPQIGLLRTAASCR